MAFVAILVLSAAAPAGNAYAAGKDDPSIYNKSGKGGKRGPVSFSQDSRQGARGNGADELPFSERMARKKDELHQRIADAAAERAAETKTLVDQINAAAGVRSMKQPPPRGANGAPQAGGSKKTYVYNPDGKKKEDRPNIVVTPDSNTDKGEGGPFGVFKFNKKK